MVLVKKLPILPPMRCDDGCGDCCGPVPVSEADYVAVVAYARRHDIKPRDQGITCPWFHDGRCAVYAARPLLCRLFGHVEEMRCSRGHNTNIDGERARVVVSKYPATRMLHDVLGEIAG